MRTLSAKQNSAGPLKRNGFATKPISNWIATPLPTASTHDTTLQLKAACPCGGGCPRCAPVIQPKLTIGQPNDKYEQEADRVAEQVMRMPEPLLQRQVEPEEEDEKTLQAKPLANQITPLVQVQRQEEPEEEEDTLQAKPLADQITPLVQRQAETEEEQEEEETIQTKPASEQITSIIQRQEEEEEREEETLPTKPAGGKRSQLTPNIHARIGSLRGGGRPLSKTEREFFEQRFGHDFTGVSVHVGAEPAKLAHAINAKAFTVGKDIFFGKGWYRPNTENGKRLLAHELAHTLQRHAYKNTTSFKRKALKYDPTLAEILVRIPAPQKAPAPASLATEIVQGKRPFRLVFYRANILDDYPDVKKHAENLAGSLTAPRIPSEWIGGKKCPHDLKKINLNIGATKIEKSLLPWMKSAVNCLKNKKVNEFHILGHLDEGLKRYAQPGPELKKYVTPDVRVFFHGCLLASYFTTGTKPLLEELGPAAKIFAHWEAGEPGRPVDFFEITLPKGKQTIVKKFIDNYSTIFPEKYIWSWAQNETTPELYDWLRKKREARLAKDVKKVVIKVLSKRFRKKIRNWKLKRLRERLGPTTYGWQRRILEQRIRQLESKGR